MAPKTVGVITLAGLDPSPEEVAAATKMLALSGKAKSQMQSFTNWLKKNPTEENDHIRKNTKGQERTDYLVKYMSMQANKGNKTLNVTKLASHEVNDYKPI